MAAAGRDRRRSLSGPSTDIPARSTLRHADEIRIFAFWVRATAINQAALELPTPSGSSARIHRCFLIERLSTDPPCFFGSAWRFQPIVPRWRESQVNLVRRIVDKHIDRLNSGAARQRSLCRAVILILTSMVALVSLSSCESSHPKPATHSTDDPSQAHKAGVASTFNNSLDLLHDLLGDEKNLSKVLIIKHASPEVKELVKRISKTSKGGLESLDQFAKSGDAPAWDHLGLPPGERAARDSISKAKEHELLHSSGTEFDFQLLLSQAEALNYGAHLASVAAANDPDAAHASKLSALSRELSELRSDVLAHLRPHKQ